MSELIKVFTPIKRVPTMIGKAQNGQKIPFGPYTLPQVAGGVIVLVLTSIAAMALPYNPAVTFFSGAVLAVACVYALSLVPYTGVRITSRAIWVGRLIVFRKPVSASGMPIDTDSTRMAMFIEETVVLILPDVEPGPKKARTHEPALAALGVAVNGSDLDLRVNAGAAHALEGRN